MEQKTYTPEELLICNGGFFVMTDAPDSPLFIFMTGFPTIGQNENENVTCFDNLDKAIAAYKEHCEHLPAGYTGIGFMYDLEKDCINKVVPLRCKMEYDAAFKEKGKQYIRGTKIEMVLNKMAEIYRDARLQGYNESLLSAAETVDETYEGGY